MNVSDIFHQLGLSQTFATAQAGADVSTALSSYSPIDGSRLATLHTLPTHEVAALVNNANEAFQHWRGVPAPRRGTLLYDFSRALRQHQQALARLITWECGKIISEAEGEVQEAIDICDFAVGLSRQLYGLTISSERPDHALRECWHPLGPTLIISAFNFPVAVWAWNAAIALVCGNSLIWKPSEQSPLCALACTGLLAQCLRAHSDAPEHLSQLVIGAAALGKQLVDHPDIPLVSATGSCMMGRHVGQRVAQRFGRSILELGGNNALIVSPHADLDLALRAIVFGAVGTCGQRCTSTRRLFMHRDIAETLMQRLRTAYASLQVGDPSAASTLVGPLINANAYTHMQQALTIARHAGCQITGGERVHAPSPAPAALDADANGIKAGIHADLSADPMAEGLADNHAAYYVMPALVDARACWQNHAEEVFAPLLYCFDYTDFDEVLTRQNGVMQGLSSALFSRDLQEAERFLSAQGSDCGIANVNVGTSGAEIGGAFGGEKHTGGGRESGSDAWKSYMRRMTATINYANDLPLAQGIRFDV